MSYDQDTEFVRCSATYALSGNRCSRPEGHMGYHMHFGEHGTEGWGRP